LCWDQEISSARALQR